MNINMGRIAFYLRAGNKYKIHSPLLYSFTNEVVEDQDVYYADLDLKKLHMLLLANYPEWRQNILSLNIYSRLFRIGKWFQPEKIYMKGIQDAGLSALALYYGSRNAEICIQSENLEMEEWTRKHFKMFNIPEPPIHFIKAVDSLNSPILQKALYLMDARLMDWKEIRYMHDVQIKSQSNSCLILTNLSKSKAPRKSWIELTMSGQKGCFYIDLYEIGVIIYTGNDQESVYQAIVSYRKKWFQVY